MSNITASSSVDHFTVITINGERQELAPGESVTCKPGDDVVIETFGPGGGGGFYCEDCYQYDTVHDQRCRLHPDYDPTP